MVIFLIVFCIAFFLVCINSISNSLSDIYFYLSNIENGYPQHLAELCDIKDKKISKLEKALDKACDVLANEINACCEPETDLMKDCRADCKKHWKKYLLKDEDIY